MSLTRVKFSELLLAVEQISTIGFGDPEAYLALDSGEIHVWEGGFDDFDDPDENPLPADLQKPGRYLREFKERQAPAQS